MIQGKHQKRSHGRSVRSTALLVSLLLLLTVAVGGTIAFLIDSDGPLINLFNPSQVTTHVEETIEGDVKKDVKIQNTGDTDAWIRAAVSVTWKDSAGNIYGQRPVLYENEKCPHTNCDGHIYYDLKNGWVQGDDGFYYWTKPVSIDDDPTDDTVPNTCLTGVLITECQQHRFIEVGGTKYYLSVEIIGSGIQSKPASVFNTEWASSGLTVKDTDEQGNALAPEVWTLVKSEKEEP